MKFVKFLMAAVVAVAAVGCFTGGGTDEPIQKDVKFAVQVGEVGEDAATLTVTHTGVDTDTWYGFYTTDVKKGDLTLIYETISSVNAADLQTGVLKSVTLTNLEPNTSYKYVVFGMGADGLMYGTAASATFTTQSGRTMKVHPDWSIEFVGDLQAEDGSVAKNCIHVESTEGDYFFLDYMPKADWNEISADLYTYAESMANDMKDYIKDYNAQNGTNYTVSAMLNSGSGNLVLGLINPGEYVAYMIGMKEDGSLTRFYAASEPFTITEDEASAEYSAWIGNYTFTSNGKVWNETGNGLVDEVISYDVTIEKYLNNSSYILTGWDGMAVPVLAKYDAENDMVVLYGQVAAEDVEFSDGSLATVYFAGVGSDGYVYTQNDLGALFRAEDGSLAIASYTYNNQDGSKLTFQSATFFAVFPGDSSLYYITDMVTYLPVSVTTAAAPAAVAPANKYPKSFYEKLPAPVELYKTGVCKFNAINF